MRSINLIYLIPILTFLLSCKEDENVGKNITDSITFNLSLNYGMVTDIDGNTYKTITIGTQTWMAENLRTTRYQNGDQISQVTDNLDWSSSTSGAFCNAYNTSDPDSILIYGRYYNWYAATDNRNIAPEGWHVPSNSDWLTLRDYIDVTFQRNNLKEASTLHWYSASDGDNASGFTAFPSGYRLHDGQFQFIQENVFWLTTTNYDNTSSSIYWTYDGIYLTWEGPVSRNSGWSIRCIKD